MSAPADNAEAPCAQRVMLRPDPDRWRSALESTNKAEQARTFRRELGLPADVPIVMSGHQAGFWHAGILAKRYALEACAEASGAHAAWLVVDHDTNDAGAVRYPAKESERLADRVWRLAPAGAAPTGKLESVSPAELPGDAAEDFVREGLGAIYDALKPADSLAAQIHAAVESLAHAGDVSTVFSTKLAQTALFGELREYIASDPERCREAFNEAVKGTTIRPLMPGDLPLWDLSGPVRRRVRDGDLETIDRQSLAPTAILQTMLLRAAGCDLFIHGTGGGGTGDGEGYENATARWHASWSPPLDALDPGRGDRLGGDPEGELLDDEAPERIAGDVDALPEGGRPQQEPPPGHDEVVEQAGPVGLAVHVPDGIVDLWHRIRHERDVTGAPVRFKRFGHATLAARRRVRRC